MSALFHPGRIVSTPGALAAIARNRQRPIEYLALHLRGIWGDLDAEDKEANNTALEDGSRILSAYHLKDGTKIWIITTAMDDDGQRESTCLLLPDEY